MPNKLPPKVLETLRTSALKGSERKTVQAHEKVIGDFIGRLESKKINLSNDGQNVFQYVDNLLQEQVQKTPGEIRYDVATLRNVEQVLNETIENKEEMSVLSELVKDAIRSSKDRSSASDRIIDLLNKSQPALVTLSAFALGNIGASVAAFLGTSFLGAKRRKQQATSRVVLSKFAGSEFGFRSFDAPDFPVDDSDSGSPSGSSGSDRPRSERSDRGFSIGKDISETRNLTDDSLDVLKNISTNVKDIRDFVIQDQRARKDDELLADESEEEEKQRLANRVKQAAGQSLVPGVPGDESKDSSIFGGSLLGSFLGSAGGKALLSLLGTGGVWVALAAASLLLADNLKKAVDIINDALNLIDKNVQLENDNYGRYKSLSEHRWKEIKSMPEGLAKDFATMIQTEKDRVEAEKYAIRNMENKDWFSRVEASGLRLLRTGSWAEPVDKPSTSDKQTFINMKVDELRRRGANREVALKVANDAWENMQYELNRNTNRNTLPDFVGHTWASFYDSIESAIKDARQRDIQQQSSTAQPTNIIDQSVHTNTTVIPQTPEVRPSQHTDAANLQKVAGG